MLKRINKEYFISINYVPVIEIGKEYLKKDYVVSLLNKKHEIIDVVCISIFLEEKDNNFIINKKLSFDSNYKKIFTQYFKSYDMRELLYFDLVNS
jgi:hypothetical protein